MSYNVYQMQYTLSLQDPDMPGIRYHNVIYVELVPGYSGIIHHVTGDITSGMRYDSKPRIRPETSDAFESKKLIGTIKASDYPKKVDEVLKACPAPGKQKAFNMKTLKTEQVKEFSPDGKHVFYSAKEARPPMVKCTEWTVNQAIPALYKTGIMQKANATATTQKSNSRAHASKSHTHTSSHTHTNSHTHTSGGSSPPKKPTKTSNTRSSS
ncbi:hypothetical protein EAE96_000249 [Botrytis aclada]|nr:hypothetical protein EAE96_000249 [Botrytis aclada]